MLTGQHGNPFGTDIKNVRIFFRDNKPHSLRELNHLPNAHPYIRKLFHQRNCLEQEIY